RTGRRLKNWKTKPKLSRRSWVRWVSSREVSETPSTSTSPDVGRSSPARMCMSVDLPDPDGPMIAVKRPRSKSTVTPARASTAASPSPKRRRRSRAKMIASDGIRDPTKGGGRVGGAEDRRAGNQQRSACLHHGGGGLLVDAAVDLDHHAGVHDLAHLLAELGIVGGEDRGGDPNVVR